MVFVFLYRISTLAFIILLSRAKAAPHPTGDSFSARFPRSNAEGLPDTPTVRRQTTSQQIVRRHNVNKRLDMVKRLDESCKVNDPRPSGRPYPSCTGTGDAGSTRIGYARYPNWDMYNNDLPGNPYHSLDQTEAICVQRCTDYRGPDGTNNCLGAVFGNDFCYLKGARICDGWFTNSSPGSQYEGAAVNLVGDCARWAGYVTPEMDRVCCNA